MTGHVFVVPGNLQALKCDDVLVSTDARGLVGTTWWPVFGWSNEEGARRRAEFAQLMDGRRAALTNPGHRGGEVPGRWLVDVGAYPGADVAWLLDGVREAFTKVGSQGPVCARDPLPRRVAMPVMGVGRGGFDGRRGKVIDGLLAEAQAAADAFALDVVVVAANASDYSAIQSSRAAQAPFLSSDREAEAARLASLARSGQLAIFMGAGTGIAAGLPSWSELLDGLAARVGLRAGGKLTDMGPLDAAELLRRAAEKAEAGKPLEDRRSNPLGFHVSQVIGRPDRYALSHALLAALDVDQAITTNFDKLYELAAAAIRGEEPLVVLPESGATQFGTAAARGPWLLKLHGDVDHADSIVLDRRSFVRYDARRRPLGGVLQTTLLTKHLLVVGASMTDDNVIRLVHEVAELSEHPVEPRTFGTVLSLRSDPLRAQLWHPEFRYVDVGNADDDLSAAARNLEIFLDRVALLAAPQSRHLLDPRYAELLETPEERELADRFTKLALETYDLPPGAHEGWAEVAAALRRLGASGPKP